MPRMNGEPPPRFVSWTKTSTSWLSAWGVVRGWRRAISSFGTLVPNRGVVASGEATRVAETTVSGSS